LTVLESNRGTVFFEADKEESNRVTKVETKAHEWLAKKLPLSMLNKVSLSVIHCDSDELSVRELFGTKVA